MEHFAELHLHLDGSLRPETVWELAGKQGIRIPAGSVEETRFKMQVPENCRTLEEYLERFDLPLMVLQEWEALERVSFELVEELAGEGLTYAEIRFAPQLSMKNGMSQDDVTEAVIRGMRRGMERYPQLSAGLILCCMRGADNQEQNVQTIETAKKYFGDMVCAVDLAGAESLFPTSAFAPVFARAREYGLPITIHAGEAAGADSMRTALSFGAGRIGHGVAAAYDDRLLEQLADEKICLEGCVSSNYHTKVVSRLEDHPLRRLYDSGVPVTVNSDNRTCSGTSLKREFALIRQRLGFTDDELLKMQKYAWEARFLKQIQ